MGAKKTLMIFVLIIVIAAASAYAGYSFMKKPAVEYYTFDPGEYFVTNIKDSKSLLKSDIIIKMNDKKQFEYFTANSFLVRDEIISVLNSKTYDELKSSESQNVLKSEIKDRLNKAFKGNTVVNTYFNDFVIQ